MYTYNSWTLNKGHARPLHASMQLPWKSCHFPPAYPPHKKHASGKNKSKRHYLPLVPLERAVHPDDPDLLPRGLDPKRTKEWSWNDFQRVPPRSLFALGDLVTRLEGAAPPPPLPIEPLAWQKTMTAYDAARGEEPPDPPPDPPMSSNLNGSIGRYAPPMPPHYYHPRWPWAAFAERKDAPWADVPMLPWNFNPANEPPGGFRMEDGMQWWIREFPNAAERYRWIVCSKSKQAPRQPPVQGGWWISDQWGLPQEHAAGNLLWTLSIRDFHPESGDSLIAIYDDRTQKLAALLDFPPLETHEVGRMVLRGNHDENPLNEHRGEFTLTHGWMPFASILRATPDRKDCMPNDRTYTGAEEASKALGCDYPWLPNKLPWGLVLLSQRAERAYRQHCVERGIEIPNYWPQLETGKPRSATRR